MCLASPHYAFKCCIFTDTDNIAKLKPPQTLLNLKYLHKFDLKNWENSLHSIGVMGENKKIAKNLPDLGDFSQGQGQQYLGILMPIRTLIYFQGYVM